jgi:hypothetical protein
MTDDKKAKPIEEAKEVAEKFVQTLGLVVGAREHPAPYLGMGQISAHA